MNICVNFETDDPLTSKRIGATNEAMTNDAFLWRLSAVEVAVLLIAGIVGYFLPMPFAESRLVYIVSSVVVFCVVLGLILEIDRRRPLFAESTEEIEAGILDDDEN